MSEPPVDLLGFAERCRIADAVRAAERDVAQLVTDEFIRRHPDWIDRFGERSVRRHGEQDAGYHIAFLASSIESGNVEVFDEYLRWAATMLRPRGIGAESLAENVEQVLEALTSRIPERGPLFDRYRRTVRRTLADPRIGETVPGSAEHTSLAASTRRMYVQAALAGRSVAAARIVETALQHGMGLREAYVDVVEPAQVEVGELWARGEISVATEHMATAVSEHVMGLLRMRIERSAAPRVRCVVSGVEGERHQLGARAVADLLESAGCQVDFLGSDAPTRSVVAHVAEHKPDLVALSVTMPFHLRAASELIAQLREVEPRPRIVVGGRGFRATGELWREMGADALGSTFSDVLDAVAGSARS